MVHGVNQSGPNQEIRMLNKVVIAGFLATTAIAFGIATSRAESVPVDRDESAESCACEKAPARTVVRESDPAVKPA
jgi:hypothetical protein